MTTFDINVLHGLDIGEGRDTDDCRQVDNTVYLLDSFSDHLGVGY